MQGPPAGLLQSLMQMAGQMMQHGTHAGNISVNIGGTTSAPTTTSEAAPSDSQASQSSANASRRASFQNSQARGNTQTHPTTSTHTRSTSRPQVHLAQHAMQGFDPFLPCSSHHLNKYIRNNYSCCISVFIASHIDGSAANSY